MQVLHQGGGAGSVTSTLHLSLGLARSGFPVSFVCPPGSEVEGLARAGGLEVLPLRLRARSHLSNARALGELLRRHPVALVNSQSSLDRQALAWLAMRHRLGAPLVITRRQMPLTFFLENWLVSRAAARVVAVSHAVGEALVRRGTPRSKLVVVHNGTILDRVDVPVPAASVEEWKSRIGWESSRRTVGIVARPKDQHVVLRALDEIATPVRLVLAGMGDALDPAVIARVPSRHAVVSLPFISEIRSLYELLEIVLLPSRMEGLSQSLLEAMALSKPVIVSAATGNLEVVRDRVNGRLVAPLDPFAWARIIDELLADQDEAQRIGAAARVTAREEFSLAKTVERTAALYRSMVPSRG
jgi:glycosyltransferase involved in cell wall biosynthesis